jgi:hypothetical protein
VREILVIMEIVAVIYSVVIFVTVRTAGRELTVQKVMINIYLPCHLPMSRTA